MSKQSPLPKSPTQMSSSRPTSQKTPVSPRIKSPANIPKSPKSRQSKSPNSKRSASPKSKIRPSSSFKPDEKIDESNAQSAGVNETAASNDLSLFELDPPKPVQDEEPEEPLVS